MQPWVWDGIGVHRSLLATFRGCLDAVESKDAFLLPQMTVGDQVAGSAAFVESQGLYEPLRPFAPTSGMIHDPERLGVFKRIFHDLFDSSVVDPGERRWERRIAINEIAQTSLEIGGHGCKRGELILRQHTLELIQQSDGGNGGKVDQPAEVEIRPQSQPEVRRGSDVDRSFVRLRA